MKAIVGWLAMLGLLAAVTSTYAVILISTDDPEYNTTAPGGALAGSGWQYQGAWGSFLGTAIAPHYFITAKHIGGNVGETFLLDGVSYVTADRFDDPESDLRLWRITGTFTTFASLYTSGDEVGKHLVVFGRGTQRGSEVFAGGVGGVLGGSSKGWQWGNSDGRKRWGENVVESRLDAANGNGPLLRAAFQLGRGPNEAHISVGDSGGGVFIHAGSEWRLAGVNFTVDGPYNTTGSGPGFNAAIVDEGGLYKGNEGNWSQIQDLPVDQAGGFYASRISARQAWIQGVLSLPIPQAVPVAQSSPEVAGPYQDDPSIEVNVNQRTVRAGINSAHRYFRLRFDVSLRITSVRRQAELLIFQYE